MVLAAVMVVVMGLMMGLAEVGLVGVSTSRGVGVLSGDGGDGTKLAYVFAVGGGGGGDSEDRGGS